MGWGGYEDPRERKAAEEAREKMEQAQALEDGRTEALCTAIVEGLGLVANAILVAAGKAPLGAAEVCCQSPQVCGAEPGDCEGAPAGPLAADLTDERVDPELDGLLDQGDGTPEQ